ncbi:MAG: 30S ribosomal protein S1 [Defluviitaleaceae bacterium]|nr:30S ribosomal protein S1 [Defluviitaleaceae bacterium]MCL2262216.1 30S ribosomal protein S1 [Defluviitaleaceae bacterium]
MSDNFRNTNENIEETAESKEFREMLDESLMTLKNGAVVKGTVVRVTATEVIVDLGFKSDGIVTKAEYTEDSSAVLTEIAKQGDIIDVFVIRVNDGDGNVLVSKKKVDSQKNIGFLEDAFNNKTPIAGKITDVIKGGLTANIMGCRAFVPASQISSRFESDLESFKGKELNFNIIEFDRSKAGRWRIVAGRRELAAKEADEKRNAVFSKIEIGQSVTGVVSRVVDFGAFVDMGGVDGLIHVSEMSWKRVRKASEVISVGDNVTATVIGFDPEKGKISLTLKDVNSNPWNGIEDRFPVGSIVDGTVARLATFGAFVTLEDGIDGLVHISQIADRHIAKPDEELSPGQVIKVKVMEIDLDNQKISLSKREADYALNPPPAEPEEEPQEPVAEEPAAEEAEVTKSETAE